MLKAARCRFGLAVLAGVLFLSTPSQAQQSAPEMLEDFVHYTLIAKPDLAAAAVQQLFAAGLSDADLANIIDDSPRHERENFDRALQRAMRVPELADIASDLGQRVETGRRDQARDSQRIDEAISMLTGTQRQKLLAQERLQAAGEYAVPKLLSAITGNESDRAKMSAGRILQLIDHPAVTPLSAALPHLDPSSQRNVCRILGAIRFPHAAAVLMELASDDSVDGPTREAAALAFRQVAADSRDTDLSSLYTALGENYFDEHESLIAYPLEATNNIWSYDPFVGLVPTAVSTDIYCEIMAMQAASRAIEFEPNNRQALSLYVAANLRRENQLPPGAADPIYGEAQYTPAFYATVFGTQVCLDVLGRGIDTVDTTLVRDAIAALSETTGGSNLFSGGGRQPLWEALQYPDRRVQYEAALTLGRALPPERFVGDTLVVPILSSAVRTAGVNYVLVLGDEEETRRVDVARAEGQGFVIAAEGDGLAAAGPALAEAIGVDLAIVHYRDADRAADVVENVRALPRTAAAPILLLCDGVDVDNLRRQFRDDIGVAVRRSLIADDAHAATVDALMTRASGGRMSEADSEAYAIEALDTLRDIAISGESAYTLADAEPSLVDALSTRTGGTRLMVADILALLDSDRAQRELFDAAFAATDLEQVDLLDRVAYSVKRFGDRAESRHLEALLDLVAVSGGGTAEAAARVYGALNLSSSDAVRLIK